MRYTLLALCLSILPMSVYGAQVVYSDTHGPVATAWTATLKLTKFDPSLGDLTHVRVDATGTINTLGTVVNQDATPKDLSFNLDAAAFIDFAAYPSMANIDVDYNATGEQLDVPPGLVLDIDYSDSGSDFREAMDQATLDAFTGLDWATFPSAVDSNFTVTGSANISSDVLTTAGVTVTVTYTYDEEPPVIPPVDPPQLPPVEGIPTLSAYGLMGLSGLLGLAAFRRKR